MAVNPSVLKNITQVVFYKNEPPSTNVLWAKPVGDGVYEFYVYYNGTWNIITEEEGVTVNISDVVGDLSTFNNDAGFITSAEVQTAFKPSYTASEVGALPDTTKYAGSQSVGGAANKAVSIPIGVVDSSSTNLAYTATVDGITELREGICCALKLNTANIFGPTLNVNNLGAKPIYISTDANVVSGNMMKSNSLCIFIYTNRIEGGCWEFYGGYNSDFVGKCLGDYYGMYKMKEVCKGKVLLVMYSESELLPLYSGEQDTGTNKTLTTESFDPFGEIFYTASSFNKDSYPSLGYTWKQYYVDMRYSFNVGTTLENRKSVYMVCIPQSDGRVKLAPNPISQTLPTTEDGFLYILLGTTYSNKDIELFMRHPIYYFKDGAIRQWTNQDTTALKLGTSTVGGTTQGIYLNQGVPAACESYDMWYMKHIAALYGATRNDATGLWSYYYKQCARWDDTNEQIVWDRMIGYDDITDEEMMSMVDFRLKSLYGCYGSGRMITSKIAFGFIGYGNNQGVTNPCAYIGNTNVQTYGYIGAKGEARGVQYYALNLSDGNLCYALRNMIGRSGHNIDQTASSTQKYLEYATFTFGGNNRIINYGVCPNIEFVSIMFTVTDNGGLNYTGCKLILHPDVYAKIFDSTNADYTLWHKIDLANQARTNPITIQSA